MRKTVDLFDSTTGWTGSGAGVSAYAVNQIPQYIAGLNTESLVFKFAAGSNGKYISKTVSTSLSGYTELVFHVWSRNKKSMGSDYKQTSDFAYKISIDGATEFYIPTYDQFNDVTIWIKGITATTIIKITCLHDDEDYLIMSNMLAVKDEMPLDIYDGLKEMLDANISQFYSDYGADTNGILLGTVSAAAGDSSILISTPPVWIDKYAMILIKDGTHSEIHQIASNDENEYKFDTVKDGETLKYTYTNANIYLLIPVNFGLSETEIVLPGINFWGMTPEQIMRQTTEEEYRDTMKADGSVEQRLTPANFRYTILIDGEARQNELVAFMSEIIRKTLARKFIWINGKKIDILPDGAGTYVEPMEGYNQIPKCQFRAIIEIREEIYARGILVKSTALDQTFEPSQGTL